MVLALFLRLSVHCACDSTLYVVSLLSYTQFLYLCKSNEVVLKRNMLNQEISQGKLQNLEGKDSVSGLGFFFSLSR